MAWIIGRLLASVNLTRPALALCLLLALFSLSMIVLHPVPWVSVCGGLLIVWVSALPALLYLQGIDRTAIPFLPAVGAYYLVFYGISVFTIPLASRKGDSIVLYDRIVVDSLDWDVILLVASGLAVMFAAFYVSRKTIFINMPRLRLPNPEPSARVLSVSYWVLITASLSYRLVPGFASLPSVGQFLGPAGYVALGGFFLLWHSGRLPRWERMLIILIVLPLDFYARLRFLFITDILFLGMFVSFILWRCGRIRLLASIGVVGTLIAFSYSATTAFRVSSDTFIGKVHASLEGIRTTFAGGVLDYQGKVGNGYRLTGVGLNDVGFYSFDPRISPLVNRISHVWIFQMVSERTPDPVPYWNGHTYRPLFTAIIPRVLYPNKPEDKAGGEFGLRYGFVESEVAQRTSFNIPWMVELLVNFGRVGVLVGLGLVGIFLAALDKFLNSGNAADLEFLIGLTVIFRLAYQESNFSVMVGSIPILILALYVYFSVGIRIIEVVVRRIVVPIKDELA